MDELYSIYKELLQSTDTKFNRFQLKLINWDSRLIGITGARGVGKTTMLLQHIKQSGIEKDSLYVSADNVLVSSMGLFKLAGTFYRHGGKHLIIDEIHKYSNWSGEIKNIYDSFPNLKVILTGSSILDLYHGYGDLSRRLISYNLPGLSFREYLLFELNLNLEPTTVFDIINQRTNFKIDKPLMHFKNYLGRGHYPFYKEGDFNFRLNSAINAVLETDIPKYLDLKISTIEKLKQLMQIIAESSPFKPNLSKIAEMLNVSRNALPNYLSYLERAELIKKLTGQTQGIRALGKTSKVYLNNTNLMNALALNNYNLGNARETFFVNQLTWNTKINLHDKGDFIIDEKHIFEIGGKNKTKKQIRDLENAYIVKDDIEFGYGNTIPLWHFGMMY
jgi:predicted AAA+ superfamily ATPase